MAEKVVMVRCQCCDGSGFVPLTGRALDTLRKLREIGHEITGADLARRMRVQPTAMNMRLKRLAELLLVTARQDGRRVFYQAV